jgi:hypothetical protein
MTPKVRITHTLMTLANFGALCRITEAKTSVFKTYKYCERVETTILIKEN